VNAAVSRGEIDSGRLELSLQRRRRWAEWANTDRSGTIVTEVDAKWATRLCERVVHAVRGAPRKLSRKKVEVIIVDDDVGGPYPAPSREPFVSSLVESGLDAQVYDAPSGADAEIVVALFGDIRSWKGRPGYSKTALEAVAAAMVRADSAGIDVTIVQFSHPRLASSVPGRAPILCAWGGEAVMQRAAARVLAGAAGGNSARKKPGAAT
jgi:hypothetical protein